ncbi:VanZ family protein [Clostridium estertheticum]|uniref:VanZ family protein n=1 Tax=Clostridium estertheticum TaxID=238834 RepID=UPI0013EE8854|nr:VanZ family protein [Clostridium estertheticum]MBZ9606471.1 VanZ family protein [Clostridium estertheticum]
MIEIYYYTIVMIIIATWIISSIIINSKNKQINWKYELKIAFIFFCVAVILRFTFFPFDLVNGHIQPLTLEMNKIYPFRINFIPLVNLFDYEGPIRDTLINVIGNTAMFIPIGIIIPLTFSKLDSFSKVITIGFITSLIIEIMQLPFISRVSDIDDLILNTVGCGIGFAFYYLAHRVKQYYTKKLRL